MKGLFSLILLVTLSLFGVGSTKAKGSSSEIEGSNNRKEKDAIAKKQFLELHFFADGRGMHLVPELIDLYKAASWVPGLSSWMNSKIKNDWGLNIEKSRLIGLFDVPYKGMNIGVLGCVGCHSGRAAGVFVPGLGNKNIDVVAIGQDATLIQRIYTSLDLPLFLSPEYLEIKAQALKFASRLANQNLGNFTQGLVTVSFIRQWFYDQGGEPKTSDLTRGAVKVPALWGYEEKRNHGQFSDGFGDGSLPGWAIAVELTAGQRVETVRKYLPRVESAEKLFADFLPPPYPFPVDARRAALGVGVFETNCSGCHGTYSKDSEGLPIYEAPVWIPWELVQTDYDRLASNTPNFRRLVEENPLSDVMKATRLGDGFFAPRLVGIWARFPYLHNASIPNLMALFSEDRPEFFDLTEAGEAHRFDKNNVGLNVLPKQNLVARAKGGDRRVYWTQRKGQSSVGHNFSTDLPLEDKKNLIEYLKTL